jgi:hypothetical protein
MVRKSVEDTLTEIRKKGFTPLGILAYNVEEDSFKIYAATDIPMSEVLAMLAKLQIGKKNK